MAIRALILAIGNRVRLGGGNAQGAWVDDGIVVRASGPWTPSVHELLAYLERHGFAGVPRPLGIDGDGHERLSFLAGDTVGAARPWPVWVHSDDALVQVGRWLRAYHDCVSGFVPSAGAVWRLGGRGGKPGMVICHNDLAPYNAVWDRSGRLVGFIDWDFAGPLGRLDDLALAAFAWVPLHARELVAQEGFTRFGDRGWRLEMFLDAYGCAESPETILKTVVDAVGDHAAAVRAQAAEGDRVLERLIREGSLTRLDQALVKLRYDFLPFPTPEGDPNRRAEKPTP